MRNVFAFLLIILFFNAADAQKESYVAPTDTAVQHKLAQWQDLKFGLFMHWGPYSQWGVVESWSICPEDEGWTQRRGSYSASYNTYKTAYENLQTTFNPTKFRPGGGGRAAGGAGGGGGGGAAGRRGGGC